MDTHWLFGLYNSDSEKTFDELKERIGSVVSSAGHVERIPPPYLSQALDYLHHGRGLCEENQDPGAGKTTGSTACTGIPWHEIPLVVNLVAVDTPYGFVTDRGIYPCVSFRDSKPAGSEQGIVINITKGFFERILKKHCRLSILAQIIFHEVCVNINGQPRLAALLEEHRYNSFQTTCDILSDRLRDVIESCAAHAGPSTLEILAEGSSNLADQIHRQYRDILPRDDLVKASSFLDRMMQEVKTLLRFSQLEDYSTGTVLGLGPGDIIHEQHRAQIAVFDVPSFYTPPYLAAVLGKGLSDMGYTGENESGVRVIRDIIAYRESGAAGSNDGLLEHIREWVDLFLDFSEKNITGLALIKAGILEQDDVAEIRSIISAMIEIHQRICRDDSPRYTKKLQTILEQECGQVTLGFSLNKLINEIHQQVLNNVFGVFKGWKSILGEVNTASNKIVSLTVDDAGTIAYFPANKVNVIDYSGDFRDGRSVVARTILMAYLSTNIHLRDNCYIDCISHTNKAWFFVDLGVHGANIFVDLDPNKRTISASYAEGDVEDGNMARLRFIMDSLTELGFGIERTDITFHARLDELTVGMLDAQELVRRAIWTIQAFASVADFDQEIEDGRISDRSLKYHRAQISASGTGYPLYKMTRGVHELRRLSESLDEVNTLVLSTINAELERLGLARIPEEDRGAKAIETRFNNVIAGGIAEGKYLSLASNPVFPNPSYTCPDPAGYFSEHILEETCLNETARIVNILDRIVGSSFVSASDGNRITCTRIDILTGKISFYAVRDEGTYRALQAFAVDGTYLRTVCGTDNIIKECADVTSLLAGHGYHIDAIAGRTGWTSPMAPMVRGISIPAIRSCTGIATGVLKKNLPGSVPADFHHAVFSDAILTPHQVGRLKDACGFLTTDDSTLSHAQLTARTFNKPGVIVHGATWVRENSSHWLKVPAGTGSYLLKEGQVVTIDAVRGMVNVVGASTDESNDVSDLIRKILSLLVRINASEQIEESLHGLQGIIRETTDVEVLKFIIQELFITNTLTESRHKVDILRSILEESPEEVSLSIEGYIKDIILDHQRRLASDYETAKHRLQTTHDVHEALFVRNKIQAQLTIFRDMENIVCDRIGLNPADYRTQHSEMDALYREKAEHFVADALDHIKDINRNLPEHEVKDLEKALRLSRGISLLPGNDSAKEELAMLKPGLILCQEALKEQFRESGKNHVVDLSRCSSIFSDSVGNKAAVISDLRRTMDELNVPPGFVLTTHGVRQLIAHNTGMVSKIEAVLNKHRDELGRCLQDVSSIASAFTYPKDIRDQIVKSYHQFELSLANEKKFDEISRLCDLASLENPPCTPYGSTTANQETCTIGEIIAEMNLDERVRNILLSAYETSGGVFVVVRSSSILEDTYEDMMAGRFKSYPYVRGEKILLEAILKCLAFYWVEIGGVDDTQPVLVHHQIESDVSMVVNSINLADHRWDEVMINSARGAGAGLVSGRVDSDLYFVDAASFVLKRAVNPTKNTRTIFDRQKGYDTVTAPIETQSERIKPSLSEHEASRVAQLARKIHDFFSYPVDIEAVMHDGAIHIVQVRPMIVP